MHFLELPAQICDFVVDFFILGIRLDLWEILRGFIVVIDSIGFMFYDVKLGYCSDFCRFLVV